MSNLIEFEIKDGVAILKLNRPETYNSFTIPMAKEMQEHLDTCMRNDEIRAILLTGNGKAFCAGQDLKEAISLDSPDIEGIVEATYNPIVTRLRKIEKPIICAVNGVAAGAGVNIALACDLVIAAESATFVQAFNSIGLIPDSAGTFTLPRLVGMQRAAALMFLDEKLTAKEAENIGMIYKAIEDSKYLEYSMQLAQKLSQRPTKSIGLTKRLLNASWKNSFEEQLALERKLQAEAGKTDDHNEGVNSFLEKRKPTFTGK